MPFVPGWGRTHIERQEIDSVIEGHVVQYAHEQKFSGMASKEIIKGFRGLIADAAEWGHEIRLPELVSQFNRYKIKMGWLIPPGWEE